MKEPLHVGAFSACVCQPDKHEMNAGVYEIVHAASGKRYIGSSVNITKRLSSHRRRLNSNEHHTTRLQLAWNKYGADAFECRIVLICEPSDLLMYEQIVMDGFKPEYNVRPMAHNNLGVRYSAETRAKISAALKGNKNALGWRHTPEERAKVSAAKLGKPSGMLGHRHSLATRAKMSKPHKISPEGRARIAAAASYKRSVGTRVKMSATHKGIPNPMRGRKHSAESRANMSRAHMGKKQSPETIAKRMMTIAARKAGATSSDSIIVGQ